MSANTEGAKAALTPVNPFYALRYHFGMLLGVEDFETEQAYHRGKSRLHNAWLHGAGVVWGLDVTTGDGEVRVAPGLALDAAGHELHLGAPACLDLARWYAVHHAHPDLPQEVGEDGLIGFDAHVVARFRPCLSRPVPALAEPCAGARSDTAFSRVMESVELLLVPGLAPAAAPTAWPRVRLLFGLAAPRIEDGAVLAADQAVLDARAAIDALPAEARPAACLSALRRFAALDAAAHGPPAAEDEQRLFPASGCPPLVLADISGLALRPLPPEAEDAEPTWALEANGSADITVRATLLPTAEIQALLCHDHPGAAPAAGPRGLGAAVTAPDGVRVDFSAPLIAGTVDAAAFSVSARPVGDAAAPWRLVAIDEALPAGAGDQVQLSLSAALDDGHEGDEVLVRIIAHGAGPQPLLGADLSPLGGEPGHDHVTHLRWTRGA